MSSSIAQMVGPDCYLNGTLVQVGIDGAGGYEGVNTVTSPPLAGMNFRSNTQYFGFVANPQINAWATFDGDFFTPGSPENGWGFELINGATDIIKSNNRSGFPATPEIPGSLGSSWQMIGSCIMADWNGSYVGSGYDIGFKINYYMNIGDLFYTTTVTVKNNGAATIPDFYYYRNFDPDNNIVISGDYSTTCRIVSQPGSGCNKAHVSATSVVPASQPMSYVGMAGVGNNFRVSYGGFSNRDGSDIWNGVAGLTGTVGSTLYSDIAISLAYRIQNLAPGASETFKFVIILDDLAANNAISNLFYFTYPGSTATSASICVPSVDTVVTCPGVPVPISVTGTALSSFTWAWTPTAGLSPTTGATVNASPTSSTLYTATGTPTSACYAPVTVKIYVKVIPGPTITCPPATKCSGSPPVTLTASGAATYTWSPATGLSATTGASVTANPTATTTYTITGTTAAGCVGTTTVTVTVTPGPTVTVPSLTKCASAPGVTLTASGATTYTWSPATGLSATTGTSVTANPASTTTYTIVGTTGGCSGTTTATVTVNPNPTITCPPATICNGSSAILTASGASTYTWSPATGLSATTGTSVTANPTTTTTYTVTGTSATGCTGTTTVVVTVNPLPVVTSPAATICTGASTTLTASGASTYTWSPATGLSATTGTSVIANPTSTTTYTITGTNINGCVSTTTSTVTVGGSISVTVAPATICNGLSTNLTATGSGVTYTWSPATGLSATTGATVTANPTTTTTYTVNGTSAAGCTGTTTVTVTVNALPTVTSASATICTGNSTPLTGAGATSYTWSPATGLSATTGTSITANPTATTTYTLTGTDVNGCVNTGTTTVTVNALPTVTTPSSAICIGNSTTLTSGGASTYTWSPATGLSATTGTSVTANPISTTTYTITGTDINGCVNTTTSTLTVNALPTLNVNNFTMCAGETAPLTATGATSYAWTPAGTLSASTGSSVSAAPVSTTTYTITGTDVNGCVSTIASTVTINTDFDATITPVSAMCQTAVASNLTAVDAGGTWSGTGITDAVNGTFDPVTAGPGTYVITYLIPGACGDTSTTTINVIATDNPAFTSPAIMCVESAPATLTPVLAGGTWTSSCGTCISGTGVFDPAAASVGANTVTYTTSGMCPNFSTNTITVDQVTITGIVVTDVSCFGLTDGTITINTTGGATQFSDDAGASFQTSNLFNEGAATYNVQVTNANGCVDNGTATVNEPSLLTITAGTLQNETCFGMCDGQVAALPAGGSGGYIVSWTGTSTGSGLSMTNVCSGPYTATVTDANGCTASAPTSVTGAIAVTIISVATTPALCNGAANGDVTVTGSATVTGYSINGGAFGGSNTFSGLIAGTYNVAVIDANGCTATGTAIVTEPAVVTITASADVTICNGQSTTISAIATGGNGTYSYLWNDPSAATTSSVSISPTATGANTFTVTVLDGNGCGPATDNVVVTVNPPLSVIASPDLSICPGATAAISAIAGGGNGGPYTYTWTNSISPLTLSGSSQSVSPTATATYTVTVSDGCTTTPATDVVIVTLYPLPAVTYTVDNTAGCAPVAVNFTNTMNSAIVGSSTWSFGDGNTAIGLNAAYVYGAAGCYNIGLSVTTTDGCLVDTIIPNQICVYANPVADFSFSPQPTDVLNTEITFTNLSTGATTSAWNFAGLGNSSSTNPVFIFPNSSGGTYPVCLQVVSSNGCTDTVCSDVVILDDFLLYVPNAFTPDGDGVNDVFLPILQGEKPDSYELMIFNRWGELIFQSNNKAIGWDGTHNDQKAKEDVYVWKVRAKKNTNEDKKEFIGHVNLLR